jgi:hypothetical protein
VGLLPVGRIAWRVIDESFMKNQKVFSDAKVRLSYGVTGNQEIGLYNSLATLSLNNYAFGGANVVGYATNSAAPNPDLKWETTRQTNVGLDLGWLDNRISASIDAYKSTTKDLLLSVDLPVAVRVLHHAPQRGLGTEQRSRAAAQHGELRRRGFRLAQLAQRGEEQEQGARARRGESDPVHGRQGDQRPDRRRRDGDQGR